VPTEAVVRACKIFRQCPSYKFRDLPVRQQLSGKFAARAITAWTGAGRFTTAAGISFSTVHHQGATALMVAQLESLNPRPQRRSANMSFKVPYFQPFSGAELSILYLAARRPDDTPARTAD
jgi:hypothetical protein